MADILERLNRLAGRMRHQGHNQDCVIDAMSEIERLRAALHRISLGSQDSGTTKEDLGREARAALSQEKK